MNLLRWIFIGISTFGFSQEMAKDSIQNLVLGDSTHLTIFTHGDKAVDGVLFLNVHEDEVTSIEALKAYAKQHTIHFFYLMHEGTRRVKFELDGKEYNVDPNRIFTKKGRKRTLKDGGRYRKKARKVAKHLATQILNRVVANQVIVAVHNNTDVNYSIKSYLPNGDEAKNTAQVYVNDAMDADDFIYTTDKAFFEAFKGRGVNVILQDNEGYVNDGSLSVYCGINGMRYINIETQKGHFDAQMRLIGMVMEIISEEIKSRE